MPTLPQNIAQPMHRALNRNLLKSIAGHNIFCPACQSIMDWRGTVVITFMKGDKPLTTKGCCVDCWDSSMRDKAHAIAAAHGATLDVVDARDYR